MPSSITRRTLALVTSASLLASMAVANAAAPAAAGTPTCMGKPATIVGTGKGETIVGTAKGDVIVARGGHDRIFGKGGHDIICGNGGNDRIYGGLGHDQALGGLGRDLLHGGPGRDTLRGGPHNDTFIGGLDWDICYQGSGTGSVTSCEVGSIPWLAIAYADLTGDHTPNKGDVLISKVIDANGDGAVSAGDTIVMGQYPTTAMPTSTSDFAPWGRKWHVVDALMNLSGHGLQVITSEPASFSYFRMSATRDDVFQEESAAAQSFVFDRRDPGMDVISLVAGSPSRPGGVPFQEVAGLGDEKLIDVELAW